MAPGHMGHPQHPSDRARVDSSGISWEEPAYVEPAADHVYDTLVLDEPFPPKDSGMHLYAAVLLPNSFKDVNYHRFGISGNST